MDNYVSTYPALSGIEIGNGRVFCGKVETKIGKKVGVKVKKLLNSCGYGTHYPKDHRFCPERMNIHTGMSHAKRCENKEYEKDRCLSLLHPFSQEFTCLKEGNMKLVNNELLLKKERFV